MSLLSPKTQKYRIDAWDKTEGPRQGIIKKGYYLPDVVLDALLETILPEIDHTRKLQNSLPFFSRAFDGNGILIKDPQMSWAESCDLVIRAFGNFSPALGAKARDVIQDPSRWQLTSTEPGKAGGQPLPPWPAGGRPRTIIQYARDGTINDAVYLAHELGHLFAMDYAQEQGCKLDFPIADHLHEVQAFFTQNILYDFLINKNGREDVKEAARLHQIAEMTENICRCDTHLQNLKEAQKKDAVEITDYLEQSVWQLHGRHATGSVLGTGLFITAQEDPAKKDRIIRELLVGHLDQRKIMPALSAAGIHSKKSLRSFCQKALSATCVYLHALTLNSPAKEKSVTASFQP